VKSVKAQSSKNYSQFHFGKLARHVAHGGVILRPRKTAKDLASGEMLPFLGDCLST
jgi:hypothetical protein